MIADTTHICHFKIVRSDPITHSTYPKDVYRCTDERCGAYYGESPIHGWTHLESLWKRLQRTNWGRRK